MGEARLTKLSFYLVRALYGRQPPPNREEGGETAHAKNDLVRGARKGPLRATRRSAVTARTTGPGYGAIRRTAGAARTNPILGTSTAGAARKTNPVFVGGRRTFGPHRTTSTILGGTSQRSGVAPLAALRGELPRRPRLLVLRKGVLVVLAAEVPSPADAAVDTGLAEPLSLVARDARQWPRPFPPTRTAACRRAGRGRAGGAWPSNSWCGIFADLRANERWNG
jgi:hypothetical protein